jgi:hypothetical protein
MDLLTLVETIEAKGCSVVFIDNAIDTSGPMGRFFLTVIAAIAELEAGIISERRRESLESFKVQGRHAVGKAPYGFRSIENPDGRGLVIRPDPDTAPKLRDAIERVMGGESQNVVRQSLGMSKTGFNKLLRNPRLAGMTPDGEGVVTIDGVPRVDREAALLTMSEWTALQDYLNNGEPKRWSKQDGYGEALVCEICDGRLYKQISRTGHHTYRCTKTNHKPGEPGLSVMVHAADRYVEETFLGLHGARRYEIVTMVDDASQRLEAVATAKVALEVAQRALGAAETEEDEDKAYGAVRAAKRAIREAEALPDQRRLERTDTGLTVAEFWKSAGTAERIRMLRAAGQWVVRPGRGVDKIYLDPTREHLDPDSLESIEGLGGLSDLVDAMQTARRAR